MVSNLFRLLHTNFGTVLLMAVPVLMPCTGGGEPAWAGNLLVLVVGLLLLQWALEAQPGPARLPLNLRIAAVLYALPVLWAVVQSLPVDALGPLVKLGHPIWAEASQRLQETTGTFISLAPGDTALAALRLIAFGGLFWLAYQRCRDPDTCYKVFQTLAWAGVAWSVYTILVQAAGLERSIGLWYRMGASRPAGPFTNSSAFVDYLGLCFIAGMGLTLKWIASRKRPGADEVEPSGREKLTKLLPWGRVAGLAVIGAVVVWTGSRGGLGALIVAVLVMASAYGLQLPFGRSDLAWRLKIIVLVPASIAIIVAILVGIRPAPAYYGYGNDERPILYERLAGAIEEFPWLGNGAGSFSEFYKMIRRPDTFLPYGQAHEVYLETALDLGLPAAASLFLSIVVVAITCLIGVWRRHRRQYFPAAGAAATVLMAIHGLIDFTPQVPTVVATFVILLGAACAQSQNSRSAKTA